jgi:hypothetical protein
MNQSMPFTDWFYSVTILTLVVSTECPCSNQLLRLKDVCHKV